MLLSHTPAHLNYYFFLVEAFLPLLKSTHSRAVTPGQGILLGIHLSENPNITEINVPIAGSPAAVCVGKQILTEGKQTR